MPPSFTPRQERELAALRLDLAATAVGVELIRIERMIARHAWSDRPRAPAGGPDGGRWVSDGSGVSDPDVTDSIDGGGQAETRTEETVTEDGSRVLSIRIRANAHADWDERHTVTAPDGTRTVFETSGLTQTIRDGDTDEILARSTLTENGAQPEAVVQPARGRAPGGPQRLWRTLEAAGATLFGTLFGRVDDGSKAVFAAPASEYVPGSADEPRAIWVGRVDLDDLDQICPRHREVQALADSTAAEMRASGGYTSPQDFGNKVHAKIALDINSRRDPDFVAETSFDPASPEEPRRGARGTLRLDLLERARPKTVCVYDHKTGEADLSPTRAVDIVTAVQKRFGGGFRYIMIMIKPKS